MFSRAGSLSQFTHRNFIIWTLLAFQAGTINAGGFLACHRFVTHITGFATHFGAEIGSANWTASIGMLSVPLFFLAGSMISAVLVDRNLHRGKHGMYPICFLLIALSMVLVMVFGERGWFGEFGAPHSIGADYTLLALLCLASGIQNATVTSASGAVVRTTHLTGLTTDLGIGLIRSFLPAKKSGNPDEYRRNLMRASIIIGFVLGSAFSTFVFVNLKYLGFMIPALISLALVVVSMRSYKNG